MCHKFDEITTPLLSVSRLYKNKRTVTFNDKGVLANNSEGEMVICGHFALGNNLYMVPVDNKHVPTIANETPGKTKNSVKLSQHQASIAYSIMMCVPKLIKYLHDSASSPVQEIWIVAIAKGWYIIWLGLTVDKVNKYLDPSEHITIGHMKRILMKMHPINRTTVLYQLDLTIDSPIPTYTPVITTLSHNNDPCSVVHNIVV